ncbi:MAG: TadE/TadG family type IV pilus assembly protein [Aminipila sp.]
MFKITKRGSIGVEAAIVLPLIILGILTISYLIKINSTNETVMSMATDEVRKLSIESYTPVGRIAAFKFTTNLDKRIEANSNCSMVNISNFKYLYSNLKIDRLISFDIDYKLDCNFPILFYGPIWGKETITTRAFLGSDKYKKTKGFSQMEEIQESELVWIFPIAGQKYHKKDCPYIKVAATQTILTKNINKKYKPCSICNAKNMRKGSVIYCFFNNGKSYHSPSCSTVDRYVIEIEKSEAIERGYMPCLKCGGI